MLIVDASVAIKWFKDEPGSAVARELSSAEDLSAPELLVPEICNACWKALRRGLLTAVQVDATARVIGHYFRLLHASEPLAGRAVAIARELDHPVYDCFYLALAERERAPVVTADQRLLA